jgi:hypothetical protein
MRKHWLGIAIVKNDARALTALRTSLHYTSIYHGFDNNDHDSHMFGHMTRNVVVN